MKKLSKPNLPITLYSTPAERFNPTPKNPMRITWISGLRGKGLCIPKSEIVRQELQKFGLIGIEYNDSIPLFSPCRIEYVTIEITANRNHNLGKCDKCCAEKWNKTLFEGKNNWTATSVADWRREHKCTWHELNDMQTCELIPTIIHAYFGHLGGVGEAKRKNRYLENLIQSN